MSLSIDIDDNLYFYDDADKEHVGIVTEAHSKKVGREKIESYYIVAVGKQRIRVDEPRWEKFTCTKFPIVINFQLSPITKGAIVHVTDKAYDCVYEAEVLKLLKDTYETQFQVRFRKFIKPRREDLCDGYDTTYKQAVNLDNLTLIKNGTGRRLERP
jgi:hypothetical protein